MGPSHGVYPAYILAASGQLLTSRYWYHTITPCYHYIKTCFPPNKRSFRDWTLSHKWQKPVIEISLIVGVVVVTSCPIWPIRTLEDNLLSRPASRLLHLRTTTILLSDTAVFYHNVSARDNLMDLMSSRLSGFRQMNLSPPYIRMTAFSSMIHDQSLSLCYILATKLSPFKSTPFVTQPPPAEMGYSDPLNLYLETVAAPGPTLEHSLELLHWTQ